MLYRDVNTTVAAMETMNSLLCSASCALSHWLMTAHPSSVLATQFWNKAKDTAEEVRERREEDGGEEKEGRDEEQDSASEAHSLREVSGIIVMVGFLGLSTLFSLLVH